MSFPLVDKGTQDFVPLQVFVPLMESLTPGTGTQAVSYTHLDEDGMATVTFKTYSLLWYKGSIANITGEAVESFNPTTGVAVIDTTYDDGTGLAGVPVNLTFSFNTTPPGMSNTMDARFVCE